jgi:hypothetical protein
VRGHGRPSGDCQSLRVLILFFVEDAVEQVFAEPALEGNGLAILHVEVDDVVLVETPDLIVVVQLAGEFIAKLIRPSGRWG